MGRSIQLLICAAAAAAAMSAAGAAFGILPDENWNAPKPQKPDLSVTYIERLPRYPGILCRYQSVDDPEHGQGDQLAGILNPDEKKVPAPGDTVTFIAHVKNKGPLPSEGYRYAWLIDGKEVSVGATPAAPLDPEQETTFELKWAWQAGEHFVAFEVDHERLNDEITRHNNYVVDRTDALGLHFFVEESVYAFFNTVMNGRWAYGFEDWAQFQVAQMNQEFRDTIYPSCPNGIEERVRLDKVFIIPDGWGSTDGTHVPSVVVRAHPTIKGAWQIPDLDHPEFVNANNPPKGVEVQTYSNSLSGCDGVWGFSVDLLKKGDDGLHFYTRQHRWLTGSEWPLHHELGHQLGRADHYLLPVSGDQDRAVPGLGYQPPEDYRDGMMFSGNYAHDDRIGKHTYAWDSTYRFYSEHTAGSFNRDKGVPRGEFGEYYTDIPKTNRLLFVDEAGAPIKNAAVRLYRSIGRGYTNAAIADKPAFTGKTSDEGAYTLTEPPFDVIFCWGSNGVILCELDSGDQRLYGWVTLREFNTAYWRGETDQAQHVIIVRPFEGKAQ
jgi:hypothetical protein